MITEGVLAEEVASSKIVGHPTDKLLDFVEIMVEIMAYEYAPPNGLDTHDLIFSCMKKLEEGLLERNVQSAKLTSEIYPFFRDSIKCCFVAYKSKVQRTQESLDD